MICFQPKGAIKLGMSSQVKSEMYLEEDMLPKNGLWIYVQQHGDK